MSDPTRPAAPALNDQVHYVSFGSAGGEYPSVCRAATVTAPGAWIDQHVETPSSGVRVVTQRWDPTAAALLVANPTGLFWKTDIRSDPGGAPGTWHRPDQCTHQP